MSAALVTRVEVAWVRATVGSGGGGAMRWTKKPDSGRARRSPRPSSSS